VRELHRAERDKLLRQVAELLYALTFAEQVRVEQLIDQSRQFAAVKDSLTLPGYGPEIWNAWEAVLQARLQSALELNSLACRASEPAARYLLVQKAELTLLRGDRKEAERVLTLAQTIPLRPE